MVPGKLVESESLDSEEQVANGRGTRNVTVVSEWYHHVKMITNRNNHRAKWERTDRRMQVIRERARKGGGREASCEKRPRDIATALDTAPVWWHTHDTPMY